MFGDSLSVEDARRLLRELGHTHMWSECAHGRPTAAPLVDLAALRSALARQRSACTGSARPEPRLGLGRLKARLEQLLE